jgi:Protein of unknown function (DUF2924)
MATASATTHSDANRRFLVSGRDLLIRTIAYRMQELVYGGLSKATQRKLDALAMRS